jgi:hypothetical protein
MNEILDLLPIPAERDLPPGQLEARRDALVAAIATNAGREPLARCMRHAVTSPERGFPSSRCSRSDLPSCAAECPDSTAPHGATQWPCSR